MKLSDYFESMKGWTAVEQAPVGKPQVPNPETQVSPFLRAPLPLPLQYSGDTVKQYNRPGLSSFRISPIGLSGNPSVNAAAKSVIQSTSTTTTTVTSGGLPSSLTQVSISSGSIANNAAATGSIAMAKTFALVFVLTNIASRIQLYSTAAGRDTSPEPTRPVSVPPTPGLANHIICDYVLTGLPGVPFNFPCDPPVLGANQDSTTQSTSIYWRLTNLSGSTGTVNVTLTFLQMES
jgi:hypothetical protein